MRAGSASYFGLVKILELLGVWYSCSMHLGESGSRDRSEVAC